MKKAVANCNCCGSENIGVQAFRATWPLAPWWRIVCADCGEISDETYDTQQEAVAAVKAAIAAEGMAFE